jgi:hypothetical protein
MKTVAILGLLGTVAALALGLLAFRLQIETMPQSTLSERYCMTFDRGGHVLGFCGATRAYCEQQRGKLLSGDKLVMPCHTDFETVACYRDRSGALVPLHQSLETGVNFQFMTFPCKRTASLRGAPFASSADTLSAVRVTALRADPRGFNVPPADLQAPRLD